MAKKKQSLPRRATDFSPRVADAIQTTEDVFTETTTSETAVPRTEPGSEYESDGVIFYSPVKAGDFVVDFAEISLQAATYEASISSASVKEVIEGEALLVRLFLSKSHRDSMVGMAAVSIQDVRLDVLQQGCEIPGGLSLKEETLPDLKVILSGYLDCTDETIAAFTYLFKAAYISVKPLIRVDEKDNADSLQLVCRLIVSVTEKSFDGCHGLLDGAKSLWSRSLLKLMRWLRPDLHTDEAIYRLFENKANIRSSGQSLGSCEIDEQETEGRSQQTFDPTLGYEALRPDRCMPALDLAPPMLLAKLRPYQSRAAQWMVMRENNSLSSVQNGCDHDCRNFKWPFCSEVLSLDGKTMFFYNPFWIFGEALHSGPSVSYRGAVQSLDTDACFCLPIVFSVEAMYPLPRTMRGWSSTSAVTALGCTPDYYASWYSGVDIFHAEQLLRPMPPDRDALPLVLWTPPSLRAGAKRFRI
ncbi:hypothetical protein L7F22_063640 [Adiantum nelumboides]|nr:hypothetical protein [Adiantum nelumboides]